ncbi:amino acid adenylation domain-containing protein [Sphingobacterium kitahiroshimense]|uniref:Amino acid adenylation domain-containing protein n=1 Tax=Sphingobacterium kitahiroshimense TaxID=470446 RepID=A0ABV0BMV7_9SPHI
MIESLIDKLINLNISIELTDHQKLKIHAGTEPVPENILNEIKKYKDDLIQYLSDQNLIEDYENIPQVLNANGYVMSSSQQRLWILSQFEEANIAYNIPGIYEVEGDLSTSALEHSFVSLIGRHEILRTVFREDAQGEVRQFIKSPENSGFKITNYDVREFNSDKSQRAESLLQSDILQPFNLSKDPLIRACLIRMEDEKWIFNCTMHHIIGDGWSLPILIEELLVYYNAYLKGEENPLPDLRIQYKDYASWQQEQLKGKAFNIHREYWLEQFEGPLPVLEMPSDKPRPKIKSYNGRVVSRTIEQDQANEFKSLVQERGATLFMGLLAVVNSLFYRYTGQEDIVLGSAVAGREHADLVKQIGFYVNTLALRTRFKASDSYVSLLSNVKRVVLDAYAHQSYSFDKLIEELDLHYEISRNPLCDIMIELQSAEMYNRKWDRELDNLQINVYNGFQKVNSKFDMLFSFIDHNEQITLSIEYNSDIYLHETIERFGDNLIAIVNAIVKSPEAPIITLDYLSPTVKNNLALGLSLGQASFSQKTLLDAFSQSVKNYPSSIAVAFGSIILTYKELEEKSNQLANYLIETYSVRSESRIGVMLDRSEKFIISILGILKAGAAYIPIDPTYPELRKHFIIKDTAIQLLITHSEYMSDVHYYNGSVFFADDCVDYTIASKDNPNIKISSEDLAYIIYTSGSTGEPKGVMIEHGGVANTIFSQIEIFEVCPNDHNLQFASISFDASISEIFVCLCSGGCLYIISEIEKKDGDKFEHFIIQNEIDIATIPPAFLQTLEVEKISRLKKLVTAGETASKETMSRYLDSVECFNAYGPTEASICASIFKIEQEDFYENTTIPIGNAIHNVYVYIVDSAENLLPMGAIGELCIGGAGVARGYLNKPRLTEEKFVLDPFRNNGKMYKSGDLAKLLPDGTIEFLGRKDSQVKINGHRIELDEIDNIVIRQNFISNSCTVLIGDEMDDKELVTFYTASKMYSDNNLYNVYEIKDEETIKKSKAKLSNDVESIIDSNTLKERIKSMLMSHLPFYMVPNRLIQVDSIPLLKNGKVDFKTLVDLGSTLTMDKPIILPQNEMQAILMQFWKEILSKNQISIKDNFFELGGNSLKMTRLFSLIQKELQVKIELNELFLCPVLENQAELIGLAESKKFIEISQIAPGHGYTISSPQRRLWVLSQLEEGNIAYNIPGIYEFEGDLSTSALEHSFVSLIGRHEILRTVFREDAQGEVRQFIKSPENSGFKITNYDVREFNSDKSQRAESLLQSDILQPFNLSKGPLIRACLIRMEDEKWIFIYTMHHIISDGWSLPILIEELLVYYNAYLKGEKNPLPDLRIQYKDYASWQQKQLKGKAFNIHREYWLEQFEGPLPVLEMPSDKPRPKIKSYNGRVVSRTIEQDQANEFKSLVQERGATLFMGLLAVVNSLFYRYTGQEDIVLGSAVAGREHADLIKQIGFYVNMLPLRIRFNGNNHFLELLDNIKNVSINAYAHQSYPFDELVDEINLNGDPSRHALFDVAVVLQNFNSENSKKIDQELDGLRVSAFNSGNRVTSLFDFRFDFEEMDKGLGVNIEYCSDLYTNSRIERLADNFIKLFQSVIQFPKHPLFQLDFLSDKEKLLFPTDGTNINYPRNENIISLFEKQILATPNNIALKIGDSEVTYSELNEYSNKIAHFLLKEHQIETGEGIGLLLERDTHSVAAMLGILKSGGKYIPIDGNTPEDRIGFIIEDSKLRLIITEARFIKVINRLQWTHKSLESYLCINTFDVFEEKEEQLNVMMDEELWDHVGENAADQITGGGWLSSFTGEPISEKEMEEYSMNAYYKLKDLLHKDVRVFEIGCSSALTLNKIAPHVLYYLGTDLSARILENTAFLIEEKGYQNVKLKKLAAHELEKSEEKDFDLVIINSVVQHFHGHNYFKKVLKDVIGLLKSEGKIFIGDVMDLERKADLVNDLEMFKSSKIGKGYKTKTDFSADLFLSKDFFQDLRLEFKEIADIEFSEKIRTIDNELTKYRYDVILSINKNGTQPKKIIKHKRQLDAKNIVNQEAINPSLKILPENPAYVIYTSGTTGIPNGVVVSHKNVVRLFKTDKPLFDFGSSDVWTMFHSYSFDFSVWEMYGALLNGGKLILVPKIIAQDPASFFDLLQKEKVTVLNQTPSAFYNLLNEIEDTADVALELKYLIFGGEALNPKRLNGWIEKYPNIRVINMYGITETTVHVTYKEIKTDDIKSDISNIGVPIPTLSCYVLDQYLQPVPIGVPGELFVGGAGLSLGYLNREKLTERRFVNNPFEPGTKLYRSGDRVMLLENGEMQYLGRFDDQVKVRGFRIELAEIEFALKNLDNIDAAIALCAPNSFGENEILAYFISKVTTHNVPDLLHALALVLPSYMLPTKLIQLSSFPLNKNGKIDKAAIQALNLKVDKTSNVLLRPNNIVEAKLISIWESVLGRKNINNVDDFFDLGGHSLKATRLSSMIHKEFNIKIPLRDLFTHTSLTSQAKLIDSARRAEYTEIKTLENQESYFLSSSQRRIWILSQFIERNIAYNMPAAHVFEGNLNIKGLQRAFDVLIARHEILRTVFVENGNYEVRQYVKSPDELGFAIHSEDLRVHEDPMKKAEILVSEDFGRPFDLSSGPLIRASLYQVGDSEWVFSYVVHHIISDGWSMEILFQELLEVYNGYVKGMTPPLVPLRIQYRDYAAWQQEQLVGPWLEEQKKYWLEQLSGELPIVDLAADKPRPAVKTYNGGRVSVEIGQDITSGIKAFSRVSGGTLFMGLLCAVNALIYRYSGQTDIIIGTAIAGREHADLENQIGFYVNTLALRTRFGEESSFRDLFGNVKDVVLGGDEHQHYPFDELIEAIGYKGDNSRHPVFDVSMALRNWSEHNDELQRNLTDVKVNDFIGSDRQISLFDLHFEFIETASGLRLNIDYNSDIYCCSTIERLGAHLLTLVESAVREPSAPIIELDYIGAEERALLLSTFNGQVVDIPETNVVELFEAQVRTAPGNIAVVDGAGSLSYGELNSRANQLAHYLRETYSVAADDLVGICLERSADLVICILGVLKSGGAYMPVDPSTPVERKEFIRKDSGCRVFLDERELLLFYGLCDSYGCENLSLVINPRNLAYSIYTSGSTGLPKGVLVEHHSLVNLCFWNWETFSLTSCDRATLYAGVGFDASVWELFPHLITGGCLYVVPEEIRLNVVELSAYYIENGITISFLPTSIGEEFIKVDNNRTLRYLHLAGDKLNSYLKKHYEIVNNYGPTETTVAATSMVVTEHSTNIPIGRPISNTKIYITDARQNIQGIGVVGEICIGGAGVARGYLNQPALTAEKFISSRFVEGERIYRTGDLGRWTADGTIEFFGRRDGQVKVRGNRIELGEIEYALKEQKGITSAVVVAHERASGQRELVAYIVGSEKLDGTGLGRSLGESLPVYMLPSYYIQIDEIPLTVNGKVDRQKLPAPENSGMGGESLYVAPANEVEERLVALWQEILGREKISIIENFFELGGNSLSATKLLAYIHKEFNIKLSLKDLFLNPTLEKQAALVAELVWFKSEVNLDNEIRI